MKLTTVLLKMNKTVYIRKLWAQYGRQRVKDTKAAGVLEQLGIPLEDANEVAKLPAPEFTSYEVVGCEPSPIPRDENHPLYNDKVCHFLKDHNALLEGLNQAKILTKTVEIEDGLPSRLESLMDTSIDSELEKLVKRCILKARVYDAMQVKLPKLKDPERPAWNFPRVYGIPDYRWNRTLSSELMRLCESIVGSPQDRLFIRDGLISLPLDKEGDLLQFEQTADLLVASNKPLIPFADEDRINSTEDIDLPDIYPFKHTVTMEKEKFYEIRDIFPISKGMKHSFIHTAYVHYNPTQVVNLHASPVTETQILGRSLTKSFTIAAAHAKQRFGNAAMDLPEPITLQCIHSDGQMFHFCVFQLNTLNIDGRDGQKNIFWHLPRIPMYNTCQYNNGKPELTEYNPEVFKRMLAFYVNGFLT